MSRKRLRLSLVLAELHDTVNAIALADQWLSDTIVKTDAERIFGARHALKSRREAVQAIFNAEKDERDARDRARREQAARELLAES